MDIFGLKFEKKDKNVVMSEIESKYIKTDTDTEQIEQKRTASLEVIFEDDFEDGLSDNWEIVSGNPIVVNGMLTADQDTWLLVGDQSWKNVSVEFNTNF